MSVIATPKTKLWGLIFGITLLFLTNLVCGFPGIGNPDSELQYAEAMSGHFTDWHPPIMGWLWSLLPYASFGTAPLFVLQVSCYWLGFGVLAIALCRSQQMRLALLVVAIAIWPPFVSMNELIAKDVSMAVSFLTAFAVVFWCRSQDAKISYPLVVGVFLLIGYGMLVRANGVFAGFPLILYVTRPRLFTHPVRGVIALMAAMAISIPASGLINHHVFKAEPVHPIRSLQLFDITGIAYYSRDPSVFWPGPFTNELIASCYTPIMWDTLAHGENCHLFWDLPSPNQTKTWVMAIVHHPFAYLMHRIAHFNSELYFLVPLHHTDARVLNPLIFGKEASPKPISAIDRIVDVVKGNPVASPIFCFLLGLGLVCLHYPRLSGRRHVYEEDIFGLCLSSVVYMAAYFVIGVASEYRYQLWPMMAIYIAAVLALANRRQGLLPQSKTELMYASLLIIVYGVIWVGHDILGDALLKASVN